MVAIELSDVGLFRGMTQDSLKAFLSHPLCAKKHYKRDETIYSPSDFLRSLGVLLSGRIRVTRGELVVNLLEAGDVFGAAALFNEFEDYTTTLTAGTACDIIFFPQALVWEMLKGSASFMENYVRYLSGRIHFLSDRLNSLAAGTAEEKVSQFLLCNMDDDRTVRISATGLTKRLNISRATLYRVFDSMEAAGIIHRDGKTIRILDLLKIKK